ncbi:MAG: glycosyltransferase, partial [Planctomycetes bacterium]|nr:glycosyltransferase [Planctomycetota bacterium]
MPTKTLHVIRSLEPSAGSEAILLRGLWRRLAEAGVASAVLTGDADPPACEPARVVRGGDNDDVPRLTVESDIIHLHGIGGVRQGTAWLNSRFDTPVILSPLGALDPDQFARMGWWQRRRSRASLRAITDRVGHLAALNDRELRHLQEWSRQTPSDVLEYGLDFDDYENLPADRISLDKAIDQKVMLVLGPIHPVEGLVPLLYAFGSLIHELEGWHLVLAGPETGDWRMQLESTVRRKGGEDRVSFVRDPDLDDQRSLLGRASLVVVPALQVRPPTTVLQALAAGVPVIASDRVVPNGLCNCVATCRPTRDHLTAALRSFLQQS